VNSALTHATVDRGKDEDILVVIETHLEQGARKSLLNDPISGDDVGLLFLRQSGLVAFLFGHFPLRRRRVDPDSSHQELVREYLQNRGPSRRQRGRQSF